MINYKGTPLFGEDSSVSHTSEFFAIAGTILFWLLFLIFTFIIKPLPKKPEYKEVQIVLSSTPVVQKTEEAPAPAEAASASSASQAIVETPAEEAPAVESPAVETPAPKSEPVPVKETPKPAAKPVEKPATKKVETQKPQPQKTQTQAVKQEEIYVNDFEDAWAKQLSQPKPNAVKQFRDDLFDDESEQSQNTNQSRTVTTENSTSGTVGTAALGNIEGIKSEKQNENKNENSTYGSTIGQVRDTQELGTSENGAGKNSEKSNGKDKNSVVWTDGTGARSYYNLDTELSQKAKNSMQVSRPTPFTISFSVDSDGNVMSTTIEIKNEFILSDIIKKEMKEKISSWKFGKGSGISKAQFDWILSPGN